MFVQPAEIHGTSSSYFHKSICVSKRVIQELIYHSFELRNLKTHDSALVILVHPYSPVGGTGGQEPGSNGGGRSTGGGRREGGRRDI